jgi:hypothetical protein
MDTDGHRTGVARCVYKIRRDGEEGQGECGAPATHRAARNTLITLCEMHAREVGRHFPTVPIKDGYCSFEPLPRRRAR